MDALIVVCVILIAILGGFLLSLIPEAPPPGLTRGDLSVGPRRASITPRLDTTGNHREVEAAPVPPHGRPGALLVAAGSVRRAP